MMICAKSQTMSLHRSPNTMPIKAMHRANAVIRMARMNAVIIAGLLPVTGFHCCALRHLPLEH